MDLKGQELQQSTSGDFLFIYRFILALTPGYESKFTEANLEMIHTSSWQILAILLVTTTYELAYLAGNAVTTIFQTNST